MCVYARTVASDLPIVQPFDGRWMIIEHWWVDNWCGGGGESEMLGHESLS